MSSGAYVTRFAGYAHVLARIAPGVPLVGPALGYPGRDVNWIAALLAGSGARPGIVSGHEYPATACAHRGSADYPTIAGLLSMKSTAGAARQIRSAARLAHDAGLRFRLTELGSASCGGVAGVSNSFATALWAPDALFELLRAGADGVNVHIRAEAVNGAFAITRAGRLLPRPLLYGLILFNRTAGAGGRLLTVREWPRRGQPVRVWAVRAPGGIARILLEDEGATRVRVDVRLPGAASADVQRLAAPSVTADAGVTLGGRWIGGDARWRGKPTDQALGLAGHVAVWLTPYSAALVTVHRAR
jgi:hypothetical protein